MVISPLLNGLLSYESSSGGYRSSRLDTLTIWLVLD
jgi:hypothetical protein